MWMIYNGTNAGNFVLGDFSACNSDLILVSEIKLNLN